MSLRNLTAETMIGISAAWLDPKRTRPLIEGLPTASGLLPKIKEVHGTLVSLHASTDPAPSPLRAELDAVKKASLETDLLHDRKLRAGHNLLSALADATDDPARAAAYLDLRDLLFPDGLSGAQRSMTAEAGAVEVARERMTPKQEALARSIPLPDGQSLHDLIEAWIKAGHRLGQLDEKRRALEEKLGQSGGVPKFDVAHAKNQWIRVARSLTELVALDHPPPETENRILAVLREEEARADRRGAAPPSPPATGPGPASGSSGPASGSSGQPSP